MAPTPTPPTRCGKCKNAITRKAHLTCAECKLHYHLACMGYEKLYSTMDAERKSHWRCLPCRQRTPDSAIDPFSNVTMARGSTRPSTDPNKSVESSALGDDAIELSVDLKNYIQEQMTLFTRNLLTKIDVIASSISAFNMRFNAIEHRITTIEKRLENSDSVKLANEGNKASGVDDLVATVDRLTRDLNDREQELLLTEVEISGISETSGENPVHIATIIGSKLGVQIQECDVVSAARVGVRRDYASAAAAGTAHEAPGSRNADAEVSAGPRVLVVRLQRRAQRDELLRAARVRRNLDTTGLNLSGPISRFYINERLTKYNRQLFKRVREEKMRLNWKYAWTKNGSILVRRDQEAPVMRIRTEADILKVFCPSSVSGN
ncbi:hypothetical protein O0L34_g3939 [Tuta absoluta]|nr:hypothetical protein O0L34_g3939 [Tuta absoluta]